MTKFNVKSYNKNGEEVKSSDLVLKDENIYRILQKYIRDSKFDNKVAV